MRAIKFGGEGINPLEYEKTVIQLRVILQDLAKQDLSEKEHKFFMNLLLGVVRIDLLGRDQLSILWAVENAAIYAGHPLDLSEIKNIAACNMFSDIVLNFAYKVENRENVVPRCARVKDKYIGVMKQLAQFHNMEELDKLTETARSEVAQILSVYDWHAKTA